MRTMLRARKCLIAAATVLGLNALQLAMSTASANEEIPLVTIRVLATNTVHAVASYTSREIAIGTRDPRAASFAVKRTLYLNGEALNSDEKQQNALSRVPSNAAGLVEVDAGSVSFSRPDFDSDGYYAEHVQVAALDEKREVIVLSQDVVYYEVRGDNVIPLSIHEYSDALSPAVQAFDRNGKAILLRPAAMVATPTSSSRSKFAAQRLD